MPYTICSFVENVDKCRSGRLSGQLRAVFDVQTKEVRHKNRSLLCIALLRLHSGLKHQACSNFVVVKFDLCKASPNRTVRNLLPHLAWRSTIANTLCRLSLVMPRSREACRCPPKSDSEFVTTFVYREICGQSLYCIHCSDGAVHFNSLLRKKDWGRLQRAPLNSRCFKAQPSLMRKFSRSRAFSVLFVRLPCLSSRDACQGIGGAIHTVRTVCQTDVSYSDVETRPPLDADEFHTAWTPTGAKQGQSLLTAPVGAR